MTPLTLVDVRDAIDVDETIDGGHVELRGVVTARQFSEIQNAPIGSLVVLDPLLSRELGGYRFDIALGAAADGLAAIISPAGTWVEPSLTAKRIAEEKNIALGRLRDGHDALSLAIQVHDLVIASGQTDVGSLQRGL